MTEYNEATGDWANEIISALRALTIEDMPSLEILLYDAIGSWILSPDNPGHDYGDQHAAAVISILFNALQHAREFKPKQVPVESEDMAIARAAIVSGAHSIAADTEGGIEILVTRIMPAAINELRGNSGNYGAQAYSMCLYSLLAISSGTTGDLSKLVTKGIRDTLDRWDLLIAAGFRLPWQSDRGGPPQES